jgi:hypothetical protein
MTAQPDRRARTRVVFIDAASSVSRGGDHHPLQLAGAHHTLLLITVLELLRLSGLAHAERHQLEAKRHIARLFPDHPR